MTLAWVGALTCALRAEFVTQSLGSSIDVNLKNGPSERGRDFLSSAFYRPAPKIFHSSEAWPAHATYHRQRCEHYCDASVGWRPYNQRVPFRFHDEIVGFVDRRQPRILIKVRGSLQSLPEQGFHIHGAARHKTPRKLSRDVQNLPLTCLTVSLPTLLLICRKPYFGTSIYIIGGGRGGGP